MKFALFLLAFHVPATLAETTYKIIDGCNNAGGICGSCTSSSPTQTSGTKYTWAGAASFQEVSLSSTATAQPINGTFRTRPILASLAPIRMASVANPAPTIK
jgi:hypothetical protein